MIIPQQRSALEGRAERLPDRSNATPERHQLPLPLSDIKTLADPAALAFGCVDWFQYGPDPGENLSASVASAAEEAALACHG